jgi:hypothetical protein
MMNNYALEVLRAGGEAMLKLANKEFANGFVIVARTPEYIVLGDSEKNVSFSRGAKLRVIERFVFDKTRTLERKR